MAAIRGKDTRPELVLRRLLHRSGLRYQLHRRDLPGRPDLFFPRWTCSVFVNGCFWHRHAGCRFCTTPKRNASFWKAKFKRNVERDREVRERLRSLGIRVIDVWECDLDRDAELTAIAVRKQITTA